MMMPYPRIGESIPRHTLPNGLQVCIVPKKDFRRTSALFGTSYGGMDMRFKIGDGEWLDAPAGIAHNLEHKMFDTEEGNALQMLATNGAEPNAFTSNAITCYYFSSTEKFYENLQILLSFVSIPYFTEESVEKEQGIIGQEIGMIEDNPEWQCYKRLMQALYKNSPARTPIAGSVESISHITAQTLYDCHKAFYNPANMCLVVVGDVEEEKILSLAGELFPDTAAVTVERDYGAEEPLVPNEKETRCQMEVAMTTFMAGFKCPPQHGGEAQKRNTLLGDLAIDVLLGESSPLYARLYSEGRINSSFGCSYDLLPGAADVYLGGDTPNPHAVLDAILAEAKRVAEEGVDEDYYQRLKNANFGSTLKGLNSFENIAVSVVEAQFRGYDPFRFPEVFDSITREDVVAFIRDNLVAERCAISIIDPVAEEEAE